ncbi:unnamed protein product [Adineta ricciae]|uniref:G-protein coupled receptors family 1 profile domain-containing protein n=1 Tax=Adineta ricciae TaxID=249248 RepID=A0A814Y573_ADIRI|nr:unnamed protein product [Adineta ricciae]CAF1224620.1 unnamed protein product [Adineta ricciae]
MSSTVTAINTIARWLNYALAIPMISLGIIGALLTMLIFLGQQSFHRNPTILYLLAGAVMTAIHLPTIYLQSILVDGFYLGLFNTNDIACRERNYLFYVTTVAAISYPCWAAFDQYASTHRQADFRYSWSSMRFARFAIFGTVVFWSIIYAPLIFISRSVNDVCILLDGPLKFIHSFVLTPIVFIMGPLVLIAGFTYGTIRNLRATAFASRHDRLTKQIRRMVIPQVVILAIFGLPFGVNCLYDDLTSKVQKDPLRKAIEHLIQQITRLIYHVIFVSTFYIYLYMSMEMRKVMVRMIRKYFQPRRIEPLNSYLDKPLTIRRTRLRTSSNANRFDY